jgi:hypothetical protein
MWLGPRRSYRRDSYGRYYPDPNGNRGRGVPGKWGLIVLAALAVIIVLASLMQSAYHTVTRGSAYHAVTRSSEQ